MTFRLAIAAGAVLLALAASAVPPRAQTTPPATTEAPSAPATPAAPSETPPAPGATDEAFPVSPAETPREQVKETFEDWQVICSTADPTRCYMFQLVKDPQGQVLAEFSMIKLPDGGQAAAGATLVTFLGVFLPKGATLSIDAGQPLPQGFTFCSQNGCFARFGLSGATVTRMKRGASAKVTIFGVADPNKAVEGVLSLKGFTAAFDSLAPVKN
jgi:invasion protein IalB